MLGNNFLSNPHGDGEIPAYHEGLFEVVLANDRPDVGTLAAMATGGGLAESFPMLAEFETLLGLGQVTEVIRLGQNARPADGTSIAAFARSMDADQTPPDSLLNGTVLVRLADTKLATGLQRRFRDDRSVTSFMPVPLRYLAAPAVPAAVPPVAALWNLQKIRLTEARSLPGYDNATRVKVAVLDTGIDDNHPDLSGQVQSYTWQYPNVIEPTSARDYVGHGTHVSGTIAAMANSYGIDGICDPELHIYKIFDDTVQYHSGVGYFGYFVNPAMYIQALDSCLRNGINVINLSIGGPARPTAIEEQLYNALTQRGVAVVAAMGNERTRGSPISYPAAITDVIAVGATTLQDTVANFSNRGNHITVCAPGTAIWSTLPTYGGQAGFEATWPGGTRQPPQEGRPMARDTDYAAWQGTSMATPHVSAALALYIARHGSPGNPGFANLLQQRLLKVPAMGTAAFHPDYGYGRLDLPALLSP